MTSIAQTSAELRSALTRSGITQQALRTSVGVSRQTLANVLKGTEDFKLSTLLGLADRLGLELLLVPKTATKGFQSLQNEPVVETMVDRVRKQLSATDSEHPTPARKP